MGNQRGVQLLPRSPKTLGVLLTCLATLITSFGVLFALNDVSANTFDNFWTGTITHTGEASWIAIPGYDPLYDRNLNFTLPLAEQITVEDISFWLTTSATNTEILDLWVYNGGRSWLSVTSTIQASGVYATTTFIFEEGNQPWGLTGDTLEFNLTQSPPDYSDSVQNFIGLTSTSSASFSSAKTVEEIYETEIDHFASGYVPGIILNYEPGYTPEIFEPEAVPSSTYTGEFGSLMPDIYFGSSTANHAEAEFTNHMNSFFGSATTVLPVCFIMSWVDLLDFVEGLLLIPQGYQNLTFSGGLVPTSTIDLTSASSTFSRIALAPLLDYLFPFVEYLLWLSFGMFVFWDILNHRNDSEYD